MRVRLRHLGRSIVTVDNVLAKTYALVEKGWCQHAKQRGSSYCLMGAVDQVCKRAPKAMQTDLFMAVHQRLQKSLPYGASVVGFNDCKGRQKKDVLDLVKTARKGL